MALRSFLSRDCNLGWVLLTYVGIFLALVYSYHQGHNADKRIVESGRTVIKSGCKFDNVRAHELRAILERGLKNQRELFQKGALSKQRYTTSRRLTKQAVRGITIRNCRHESMALKAD